VNFDFVEVKKLSGIWIGPGCKSKTGGTVYWRGLVNVGKNKQVLPVTSGSVIVQCLAAFDSASA
jgi:hypothetical protein